MEIQTEQHFSVNSDTLWRAITEHAEMIQWFFQNIPSFKAKEGFKVSFEVLANNKSFIHLWEILEVHERKKIVYDWRYEKYPGQGTVIFEITDKSFGSHLSVTAYGMDSFPQNIAEFKIQSCQDGWNYFIKDQLTSYIKSKYPNA